MHPAAWMVWATWRGPRCLHDHEPLGHLAVLVAVALVAYAAHRIDGPASRSFRVFLLFGLATMLLRTALSSCSRRWTFSNIVYAALEGAR